MGGFTIHIFDVKVQIISDKKGEKRRLMATGQNELF